MKHTGGAALLVLGASGLACSEGEWHGGSAGPPDEVAGEGLATLPTLADDLEWAPAPTPGVLEADAGAPRVFYLFYADGSAGPGGSNCRGTPPRYTCGFGSSVMDCGKQVQTYLDHWYSEFNLVFTLTQPTSGRYYAEVITTDGAWCGRDPGTGGVAPFNCGGDMGGGVCYAFQCGKSAHDCAVIIAQEQAHLVGLQHTSSGGDLLNPVVCTKCDGFEDKANAIVADMCGRGTQNSYQMMKSALGTWAGGPKPAPYGPACTDMAPPTVTLSAPAEGAAVPADFTVKADVADDCSGVKSVHVDVAPMGLSADATTPPYEWNLTGIEGSQTIIVTATDGEGKTGSAMVKVRAPGKGGGGAGAGGGNGGGGSGGGAGPGPGAPETTVSGGCAVGPGGRHVAGAGTGLAALLLGARGRRRPRRG